METPVTFPSDRFQLVGLLHTPDGAAKSCPAVVFFHGFMGTRVEPHRIFVKTARALAQRGFVALRFDFRGSGDSGGGCEDATPNGEIDDAQAALNFLRGQPLVDSQRIGIVAMSMGGCVACRIAASRPRGLKSLALWCPVADGGAILQGLATPHAVASLGSTGFADRRGWRVSMQFIKEFQAMRPADDLAQAACPVLIIHGEKDDSVPVAQTELFEKALRTTSHAAQARAFKKLIIPGATHTFDRADWEETVIKETVEWLEKTV